MNESRGNEDTKNMSVIKQWMGKIEDGKRVYKLTFALFVVLTVGFITAFVSFEHSDSKEAQAVGICFMTALGCAILVAAIKRALVPNESVFVINRTKNYYHRRGKPEKYRKLCWYGFFICFSLLLFNIVRAAVLLLI